MDCEFVKLEWRASHVLTDPRIDILRLTNIDNNTLIQQGVAARYVGS